MTVFNALALEGQSKSDRDYDQDLAVRRILARVAVSESVARAMAAAAFAVTEARA